METKTRHTIQTLAKVGKVLSKIVSICCIVGAVGCIVGILSLAFGEFEARKIGGITIHSIIERSASIGTMYAEMTVGLIFCIGEAVIAKLAATYFQNEIAAGTPFTLSGAKELLRLGICTICISVGAWIGAEIAYTIITNCFSKVADMQLDGFSQVGTGIAMLLASLLCKYGAEKNAAQ